MNYLEFIERHKEKYEVVKLRCEGKTFKEIGNEFNLCEAGAKYRNRMFISGLYHCYVKFLENKGIKNVDKIWDFYVDTAITVAAMEKIYNEQLSLFRQGNAPLLSIYYKDIPHYRELTKSQIVDLEKIIVGAKKRQMKSYAEIGKMLDLTNRKIKDMYQSYYHRKVKRAVDIVQPTVGFDYFDYLCDYSYYPQIRWKLILEEYSDLVHDLKDEYDL